MEVPVSYLASILPGRILTDLLCVSQCHVNMVNFLLPCSIIALPATISWLSGPAHTSCLISFRSGGAAGGYGLQADNFSKRQTTVIFDSGTTHLWRQTDPMVEALVSGQRRERIGCKVAKTRLACYLQIRVCGLYIVLQDAEESIYPTVCWSRSPRLVLLHGTLEGIAALATFYSLLKKKEKTLQQMNLWMIVFCK